MEIINFSEEELHWKHGIYKITNKKNNKIYIGSAINLSRRWHEHTNYLNINKHFNRYLQNSWNKYGKDSFTFEVIEFVEDENKLLEREQFWIDKLNVIDKNIGYNINPTAGSRLGSKMTFEQIEHHSKKMKEYFANMTPEEKANRYTEEVAIKISKSKLAKKQKMSLESRKKMSIAKMGKKIGKRSKEVGEKISKSKMGHSFTPLGSEHGMAKYDEELVIGIKLMLNEGYSVYEVADKFNIKRSAIYDIKAGRSWSHILPNLNLSKNNRAGKLNYKKVREIKHLLFESIKTLKEIAEMFNVSEATIKDIRNGRTWKNVKIEEVESLV
jgi:group I intron endonuclease